jgi:hypothetical protein
MKKLLLVVLVLGLTGGMAYGAYRYWQHAQLEGPTAPTTVLLEEVLETKRSIDDLPQVYEEPAASLNIEVPFFTQAPYSNWDYPWQEACEEASVLGVANLYLGLGLNLDSFNTKLLELVDWETEYFGSYQDTTAAETVEMLQINFGLEGVVHDNPTFEDIQEILADGHLIIAPFAGKLLGNPNFRNGGPLYHMLIIKGYDAEKMQLVTNDVGTRNGADYVYAWATIENALHDWDDTDILLGTPRIIEVLPPQ